MTVATRKLTAEEYFSYDNGTDNKYELVNGELVLMSVGKGIHTFIIDFLIEHIKIALLEQQEQYRTLPSGVCIRSPRGGRWNTYRIPDITVLPKAQAKQLVEKEAAVEFADPPPPLVVEVVSPSTKKVDYKAKWTEYSVLNIQEYWIVDPLDSLVTVCVLEDGMYTDNEFRQEQKIQSPMLPSFSLTAAEVLSGGF